MFHQFRKLLAPAALLLLIGAVFAQPGPLAPDQIDPYTFDPLAGAAAPGYLAQATEAYNAREYENAARHYLAHLQNRPDDSTAWYNLACCYGLLNKPGLAAKYLMQSYKAGYTNLEHIKADPDFSLVREEGSFAAALDSLRVWTERKAFYEGERKYLATLQLIPYQLHLPKNYDPAKKYPLLIGLHGYGDKASAFSRIWRYLEDEDVILAVPEAPYPFTEGQIGFSWQPDLPFESKEVSLAGELLTGYVYSLREELAAAYSIGDTWLLGFSQGAYLGYMLALKNPGLCQGLVACGGGLMTEAFGENDFKAGKDLKIIISHGRQDRVVPFSEAENARQVLEDKGFKNVFWIPFEGGHTLSPLAIDTFLAWIN